MGLAQRCAGGACGPPWASRGPWWRVMGCIAQSIPPEAARRLDGDQLIEIEVNDRLQCLAGSTVAQPLRESVEPGDILGLQGEQFGDGGTPSLRPVGAPDGARHRRSAVFGLALAIACLPLGGLRPLRWPSPGVGGVGSYCVT